MATKYPFLFGMFFTFSLICFAQDGSPDLSFGNNGVIETDIVGEWDFAKDIAQLNDNRILVSGEAGIENDYSDAVVIAYLPNGDIDTSFGINGFLIRDYGNPYGEGVAFLKTKYNDKFILGVYVLESGNYKLMLSQYLPNGILDTTFGINGDMFPFENEELFKELEFLSNGNILITGETIDNGINSIVIKKMLANGDLDTSFGTNGITTLQIGNESNSVRNLEILEDSSILINAKIIENGNTSNVLIQLLPSGDIDTTFGNNGILDLQDENSCSFKLYPNDKILIKCGETDSNGVYTGYFKKYFSNGTLDTSFGNLGQASVGKGAFILQENERIVLYYVPQDPFEGGGYLIIYRLHSNGLYQDSSFQYEQNYAELDSAKAIFQNDGKIIIAGTSMWYNGDVNFVMLRFNNSILGNQNLINKSIGIYPNPSKGIYNITHDFINSETLYKISDITGKIIQQGKLSGEQTQIDISQFENGVYLFTSEGSTIRLLKN
jgi:uncharacterized delta-60 repeat protein